MPEQEQEKKQLERASRRLHILDMMEERLLQMKRLSQRVIDEDLTDEEIREINQQVQNLQEQVKLLDRETTGLS